MECESSRIMRMDNENFGKRYREKLKLINGMDPFTLDISDLNCTIDEIPPVANMDVVCYLFLTHSYYTKEQMKDTKNLQSYKYFVSGCVVNAGTKVVDGSCILVGQVKHSQESNSEYSKAWCIIAEDGSISTGHCTCVAVNAENTEVCDHIAALLFTAEHANSRKTTYPYRDPEGLKSLVVTEIPIVPLHELGWGSRPDNTDIPRNIPPIEGEELINFLEKIWRMGDRCALMSIVEPFASRIAKERAQNNTNSDTGTG